MYLYRHLKTEKPNVQYPRAKNSRSVLFLCKRHLYSGYYKALFLDIFSSYSHIDPEREEGCIV